MSFEYTKQADVVAGNLIYWGSGLAVVCILITVFIIVKQKPLSWFLLVIAMGFASGWFFYQSHQLKSHPGEWVIRVENKIISWQSPNEKVDQSFSLTFGDIDFIDRSAKINPSDPGRDYRLILQDGSVIKLDNISGIDLDKFTEHLSSQGIEIKETGKYVKAPELRPK